MSGDSAPPPPKDQFASTMGPAVQQGYGAIQNFQNGPNLPQQTYGQASGAFGGNTFNPSGYDPAGTVQAGNWMTQQGQSMSPYISQIFAQGFDPQNEYYGRAAHDLTEQTRVALGDRGLAMSPYGAGVEGKVMGDFGIDWRDRQLGRQTQAAGAASGLNDSINRSVGGGQQIAQSAGTWQGQIATMLSQLGLNTDQHSQQAIQDWLAYMNEGSTSANNRWNAQFQNWNAENANDAAMWSGIGNLAGSAVGVAGGMI